MNSTSESVSSSEQMKRKVKVKFQQFLDKSAPHKLYRWLASACLVLLYALRVWYLQGFYIVTYGLGIYNLNLLLGFITPRVDPELEGPVLPSKSDDEYRPFVRRLQEMKFWMLSTRAFLIGFCMTFVPLFDVPVFWPILLLYWFILLFVTMQRQIKHMIKHKYLPFDIGKKVTPVGLLDCLACFVRRRKMHACRGLDVDEDRNLEAAGLQDHLIEALSRHLK